MNVKLVTEVSKYLKRKRNGKNNFLNWMETKHDLCPFIQNAVTTCSSIQRVEDGYCEPICYVLFPDAKENKSCPCFTNTYSKIEILKTANKLKKLLSSKEKV